MEEILLYLLHILNLNVSTNPITYILYIQKNIYINKCTV